MKKRYIIKIKNIYAKTKKMLPIIFCHILYTTFVRMSLKSIDNIFEYFYNFVFWMLPKSHIYSSKNMQIFP